MAFLALAVSCARAVAMPYHDQHADLTPAQWSLFAGAVTSFAKALVTYDRAQRNCVLSSASGRTCRARADAALLPAYTRLRSGAATVVAEWPGACHTVGAEVVASLTRSYNDKRAITRALNASDTKLFAHLESDSLLAEGAALAAYTSMPLRCRG